MASSAEATPPHADALVANVAAQADCRTPKPRIRSSSTGEQLTADVASLEITGKVDEGVNLPPHRSHNPNHNQRRSDPFQFGSRFLEEGDDPFEFNAWDHVEIDDVYMEYAEQQYKMQRQSPVTNFDKRQKHLDRFNTDPAKWWNLFYKNNKSNFFKNRKWLQQEFPILSKVTRADAGPSTLLEIGAGAGNTAFPILALNQNPDLTIHACDFSKKAVEVMRAHEAYDMQHMQADVWDIASDELPPGLGEGSVDVALLVFIFSALSPVQWRKAVENVHRVLKPGGEVCFRDYGRGDLAQVRFRKGRYLEENFYIRGDGTRVYFFEQEELAAIWTGDMFQSEKTEMKKSAGEASAPDTSSAPLFKIQELGVDRRMLVNRARRLKMYRCWLQGKFIKI